VLIRTPADAKLGGEMRSISHVIMPMMLAVQAAQVVIMFIVTI
jgi:hypothetical protein